MKQYHMRIIANYIIIPYLKEKDWYSKCSADQKAEILAEFKYAADRLTKKSIVPSYNLNNRKLQNIFDNGISSKDIVDVYLFDKIIYFTADGNGDGEIKKSEYVERMTDMDMDDGTAWELYLGRYGSKAASEAEENGIDAKLFMTAAVEMYSIKPDYGENGKAIKGSRRDKIERYLHSICNSYKEYLFLLGTEYPSVKKDADYISYFGKQKD